MIWEHFAKGIRNVDIWAQNPTPPADQINHWRYSGQLVTTQPIPSVLLINVESRSIGLKHYTQIRFSSGVYGDNNIPSQVAHSLIWLNTEHDRICPMGWFSSHTYNRLLKTYRYPSLAINAYSRPTTHDMHNPLEIPWKFEDVSTHEFLDEILLYYCEDQILGPDTLDFVDIDPFTDLRTNAGARKALVHAKKTITDDFRYKAIVHRLRIARTGGTLEDLSSIFRKFPRIRYVAPVVGGVRCDGRYHRFKGLRDTIRGWKGRMLGRLRGRMM